MDNLVRSKNNDEKIIYLSEQWTRYTKRMKNQFKHFKTASSKVKPTKQK